MYLSRVEVDMRNRALLQALAVPEFLHAAIENCVLGKRQRNLWRLDTVAEKHYLLIVSQEKVDFTPLKEKFGPDDGKPVEQPVCYDKLFDRLQTGQQWRFRLSANPTKSVMLDTSNTRGKVYAVRPSETKQWLVDKSKKKGFSVDMESFIVIEDGWKRFKKGRSRNAHQVSLYTVTYEGILKITDVGLFRETLLKGIGRGKAYGCGMLTVAR
ncbi:MAG: type I-E CRISPR-associated protein Cas6/Cse3/CasE [Eubacteriales bacterium]|jgi:CRISPR system Cascade subunit CasE